MARVEAIVFLSLVLDLFGMLFDQPRLVGTQMRLTDGSLSCSVYHPSTSIPSYHRMVHKGMIPRSIPADSVS